MIVGHVSNSGTAAAVFCVCQVLCAQVVGATSSETFLVERKTFPIVDTLFDYSFLHLSLKRRVAKRVMSLDGL